MKVGASLLPLVLLAAAFAVVGCWGRGEEFDAMDAKLEEMREHIEQMKSNGANNKPQVPQFKYAVGQTVVVPKKLVFKSTNGKSPRTVDAGTLCVVTSVPGDAEGTVAEVRIQSTGTLFDPTADQIVPVEEWERLEQVRIQKEEAAIDWSDKIEALLKQHAPKKLKKLNPMLRAWKGREKDLFRKLEREFEEKAAVAKQSGEAEL